MNSELWLLPGASLAISSAPGIERVLARARALAGIGRGLDAILHAHASLAQIPWAALLRNTIADAAGHDWLIADLVSIHAEPTTARIVAHAGASLPASVCADLGKALEPWFVDENFSMHESGAGRWLLCCPAGTMPPATPAIDAALGLDLRAIMPKSRDWQRRSNEMQILLTQQTLNQARVTQGLPSANSLWFWGYGRLPAKLSLGWVAIASSDPLLAALAVAAGVPLLDPFDQRPGPVMRDLRDPLLLAEVWKRGLRPARAQLRFADGSGCETGAWDRFKFWR